MNKEFHAGRLMSYAMTEPQILGFGKTVTRRDGWKNLKVGEIYWAVRKGMGLKKGEKVQRLALLQCISNRRERLYKMIQDKEYGRTECALEGFPGMDPAEFVEMYVNAKRGRHPGDEISRIEFRYLLTVGPMGSDGPIISIPETVGVCSSCKGQLKARPISYKFNPDGTMVCESYILTCPSEGDYGFPKEKIFNYLDATFRFEVE